ncbi:pyridoxamine 5'-phosphate oxidase family protein [Massilia antarctica]|uniref:pyridoxamine 5'-phosphate oxidase family protein n=1 Tax=Massilia antarctica TaxID=2765360 RepID=UPI0027D986F0|nr:pyridoxamine 5'-phosphate oxidase family protein [Massilia antarctica]
MDSINKNQPEDNYKDLGGSDALKKLKALVDSAETCFFCTRHGGSARPMSVRQLDEQGNLWFLSADDSHKNAEIAADPAVKLYFQGSTHSEFLVLDGAASITRDKARIKELWNFILKTWFSEGEDDARIPAIKVTPGQGYYWDNKHGKAVAGVKMLVGTVIGKCSTIRSKATSRCSGGYCGRYRTAHTRKAGMIDSAAPAKASKSTISSRIRHGPGRQPFISGC